MTPGGVFFELAKLSTVATAGQSDIVRFARDAIRVDESGLLDDLFNPFEHA